MPASGGSSHGCKIVVFETAFSPCAPGGAQQFTRVSRDCNAPEMSLHIRVFYDRNYIEIECQQSTINMICNEQ